MSKATTKGGIVLEDIKIGDILYEYEYGTGIKSVVTTQPINEDGCWSWESKNVLTDEIIEYRICEGFSHYGPNVYDYEAYINVEYI